MNPITKCKTCGKVLLFGSCCKDCYYEYYESKADLMRDLSDDYEYEKEYDEDEPEDL